MKKYPERNRKVPSRKVGASTFPDVQCSVGKSQLEGTGCSASISFKTYYETEEVRVCCKFGLAVDDEESEHS